MKSVKMFLLLLSVIILNNCAHEVKIEAVASPDQMVDYKGIVTSEMKHAVSLAYYDLGILNDKAKFMIIVENYGDKPIDFSNDNIQVMFEGNTVDWSSKKIEIETPFDVMKDIQKGFMNRRRMIQRGSTASDFTGVLSRGGEDRTGVWALQSMKQAQKIMMGMNINDIKTLRAQGYYALPRVVIRPQIIMPNESISGIFVCDTSKMKNKLKGNFIISVRVDDENHKFIFSRS